MAATHPWDGFTERADLMPTALDNLADDTLSAASTELDNATNKDTHQIIEIELDSVTFVADAYLEIYMIKALDGTNYEDAPVINGVDVNTKIATIPVKAGTGARIVTSGLLILPPFKVKYYLGNKANVAFNNTTPTNKFNVFTGKLATV